MYTEFYNLKEKPFNLTPSPRFLYLSESHKEALALLSYGVVERKGFILLTGEVGTGKTTIVQALLQELDENVQCVYLSNPLLSPKDFINYLASSCFGKRDHFKSKAEFLLEFEMFLRRSLQHQKNFILIIDEAQKLSFELLEEIRLLSNMETGDEKLINIFLVGQPELNEKLSEPRCRPLLQRISIRHHIAPLGLEDTKAYITTRLRTAGAIGRERIFSKGGIKAIHQFSNGYPRMINVLADNALLLGYARRIMRITPAMVKECYKDLKLEGSILQSTPKPPEIKEVDKPRARRYWKWAAVLLIVAAIVLFGVTDRGRDMFRQLSALVHANFEALSREQPRDGSLVRKKINPEETRERRQETGDPSEIAKGFHGAGRRQEKEQREVDNSAKVAPEIQANLPGKASKDLDGNFEAADREGWKSVIVKEGDIFSQLVATVYGRADEAILAFVQKHNPHIKDINRIEVGQKILFPPPYSER